MLLKEQGPTDRWQKQQQQQQQIYRSLISDNIAILSYMSSWQISCSSQSSIDGAQKPQYQYRWRLWWLLVVVLVAIAFACWVVADRCCKYLLFVFILQSSSIIQANWQSLMLLWLLLLLLIVTLFVKRDLFNCLAVVLSGNSAIQTNKKHKLTWFDLQPSKLLMELIGAYGNGNICASCTCWRRYCLLQQSNCLCIDLRCLCLFLNVNLLVVVVVCYW